MKTIPFNINSVFCYVLIIAITVGFTRISVSSRNDGKRGEVLVHFRIVWSVFEAAAWPPAVDRPAPRPGFGLA